MKRTEIVQEYWEKQLGIELKESQTTHEAKLDKNVKDVEVASSIRFVDIKFLASYLGFKVPTIRDWVKSKKIKFHKINGGIRFDLQEIDEGIKQK